MNVHCDEREDVLYLARSGVEHEAVEVAPGISLEPDSKGRLPGVEILNASRELKQVVRPLQRRLLRAA